MQDKREREGRDLCRLHISKNENHKTQDFQPREFLESRRYDTLETNRPSKSRGGEGLRSPRWHYLDARFFELIGIRY